MVAKKSKIVEFREPMSVTKKADVVYKTAYVEVARYDSNGELLSSSTFSAKKQNGSGFVISYTEKMSEFIEKTTTPSVLRVFLYLAHHQNYGVDGIYGCRCTHKHLRQVLNIDKKSVYSALTKLKEDFLVNELQINGLPEFMVNPNYVTMGKEKQARMREWNLRWEKYFKSRKV